MDLGLKDFHRDTNSQSKPTNTQGNQQDTPKSEETANYEVRPKKPQVLQSPRVGRD